MKRIPFLLLAGAASILLLRGPIAAQQPDIELPEYTDQQRWERLGMNCAWWQAGLLELGKVNGMSPEEVGKFMAKYYSQAWTGGFEAATVLYYLNRNHMAWPGATMEILSSSPTAVSARFNRPLDTYIGEDGVFGGHSAEEIHAMRRAAEVALVDFLGATLEKEEEDGHDVLTVQARYDGINAATAQRWYRLAYLSGNWEMTVLDLMMKQGMTAQQIGEHWAKTYGPAWESETPWQLYRGMTWNLMTDPLAECEVLSASADEVRARCRIFQDLRVQQSTDYTDVTLEDVLVSGRAFAEGVAEQRGLQWEESWDEEWRTIRVIYR